jgi:hypothetical protein
MKTLLRFGVLFTLTVTLFLSSCAGSYYVTDQPAEPVYEQGVAPYGGAVWIGGEWGWSGGRYVYTRGHWDHGRAGHAYVRGNWEHTTRGYRWHRGHWN